MKRGKVIFIGLCIILMCMFFGLITYLEFYYARPSSALEDDYYSVNFHKDYIVLQVPSNLKDGEQYEFIMVDKFLPISERGHGSYGFLRVNETTGLIEFIKWRTSNTSYVRITWTNESTNISDYDIVTDWIHFSIKE